MGDIENTLKKGDVIWMGGYRRRTLWQWLTRKQSQPQYWKIIDEVTAESISRLEKINDQTNPIPQQNQRVINRLSISLLLLIICALAAYVMQREFPYYSGNEVMRDELIQLSDR